MQRFKVLIVDDSKSTRDYTQSVLEKKYDVAVATDGKSAITQVRDFNPDLILMDIIMPGLSGMDVCKKLAKEEQYRDIPVIMVTSLAEAEHVKEALEAGAVDYIEKPFKEIELYARVGSALKMKNSIELLKTANATKDKFFSIISHDLKSPLISLLSGSRLLSDDIDDLERGQIKKIAQELKEKTSVLFELLENLLQWAKVQMSKDSVNPESLSLYEIVQKNISIMRGNVKEKKISVKNTIEPALKVFADKDAVYSVIHNLLSNSIKFTENGGRIVFSAASRNNECVITVSDTGMGIKPAKLKKIFKIDQNVSTPGTENEKGSGLGLILCKEFVESNGGKIWVESIEKKGSRFYFTLPLSKQGLNI